MGLGSSKRLAWWMIHQRYKGHLMSVLDTDGYLHKYNYNTNSLTKGTSLPTICSKGFF